MHPSIPKWLENHLIRYYTTRYGDVVSVKKGVNTLGRDMFRLIMFADGAYVTFCKRYVDETWFRHNGGGRHGSRRNYTNL